MGVPGFGVSLPSRVVLVLLACALGLIAFLALGYTLAVLSRSAAAATGIGNGLMIVLMLTSGAVVPLAVLPIGIQQVMAFSPDRHFVDLVRGLWNGQSWSDYGPATAVLIGMVIVFGALGARLFRWNARSPAFSARNVIAPEPWWPVTRQHEPRDLWLWERTPGVASVEHDGRDPRVLVSSRVSLT